MKGLGLRIRELRKLKGLTLIEIVKKTGIDQATLSRMENGKMTGTVDSHMRIADALGIRLPDLYNDVLSEVGKQKDKEVEQRLDAVSGSKGAVAELLTSQVLHKKMLPVLLKLAPKSQTAKEQYSKTTERFVYLVSGAAEILIDDQRHLLKQGQSLYFDASLPHWFKNPGGKAANCLSVTSPVSL